MHFTNLLSKSSRPGPDSWNEVTRYSLQTKTGRGFSNSSSPFDYSATKAVFLFIANKTKHK